MVFTDIFIKRPVLSVVVSLLILLIGLNAAINLPIRQYPKLSNTVITVTTSYPGASPDLMQGFITTPIEQAVASAEGVDYITSSSVQGTSTISVYVKLNVDPNQALTEVLSKVNSVKYLIPKESNDPVILKSTGQTTAVMYIGFSSDELTGSAISDYMTRVVQPILSTVDGVASADILGNQQFAMRIWLDPARMAGRGVSAGDIATAIQANNFQAAAGQSKGYFTVSLLPSGRWRIREAAVSEDLRYRRPDLHGIARARCSGWRRVAKLRQADEPVLVRPPADPHGGLEPDPCNPVAVLW